MVRIRDDHPLKLLFTGLVEHAFFADLGICDPKLTDYVSELLVTFVHVDNIVLARDAQGRPVTEVAEIFTKWESTNDLPATIRDRTLHRRIGDYTLFWTGVYPERMKRSAGRSWRDRAAEYVSFGKRSYAIASELTPPDTLPPPDLLRRLSEDFEFCVHGLGLVRHGLENQPPAMPGESHDLIY